MPDHTSAMTVMNTSNGNILVTISGDQYNNGSTAAAFDVQLFCNSSKKSEPLLEGKKKMHTYNHVDWSQFIFITNLKWFLIAIW